MHRATVDLEALLRALCEQEIAFVIVGGAAAILHGAPTSCWSPTGPKAAAAAGLEGPSRGVQ